MDMVDQVAMMTLMHFPRATGPEGLRCESCEDLKSKVCEGRSLQGDDVFLCMAKKIADGTEMVVIGRRPPR